MRLEKKVIFMPNLEKNHAFLIKFRKIKETSASRQMPNSEKLYEEMVNQTTNENSSELEPTKLKKQKTWLQRPDWLKKEKCT